MRSLHRAVVTGAFAGLAGVTAVASVAFACTDEAIVEVVEYVDDPLKPGIPKEEDIEVAVPGQQVIIQTDYFYPLNDPGVRPGHVVVVLMPYDRPGVRTPPPLPLAIMSPLDGEESVILPTADELEEGAYNVVATQFSRDTGKMVGESSVDLTIRGGTRVRPALEPASDPRGSRGPTQPTTPTTMAPTPGPSIPDNSSPAGNDGLTVNPPVLRGDGASAPARGDAGARPGAGGRPGSGTGSGTGSGSGGGTDSGQGPGGPSGPGGRGGPGGGTLGDDVLANIPAIPGSDAAKMLNRLNGGSEPVTGDLWSGLDPSRSPSLLDGGAPTEDRSGFPVGGLLLGGGALALAAVALVEGRRRLAVSRVTLR